MAALEWRRVELPVHPGFPDGAKEWRPLFISDEDGVAYCAPSPVDPWRPAPADVVARSVFWHMSGAWRRWDVAYAEHLETVRESEFFADLLGVEVVPANGIHS